MAPSVAPMQLLVSIVERGKGRELREHYRQFGLIHHNQAAGHGTAASHLLDALGFGTSERDIILTLGPKDTMLQLVYHLKDEDRSKLGTPGIAFTLNLSGMSAILAVALSRLEEMKPERGEQFMEQGNHHSLILATVNTLDRCGRSGEVRGHHPAGGEGSAGHRSHQPRAQRHPGGHQCQARLAHRRPSHGDLPAHRPHGPAGLKENPGSKSNGAPLAQLRHKGGSA